MPAITYAHTVAVLLLIVHAVRCERSISRQREDTGRLIREALARRDERRQP